MKQKSQKNHPFVLLKKRLPEVKYRGRTEEELIPHRMIVEEEDDDDDESEVSDLK